MINRAALSAAEQTEELSKAIGKLVADKPASHTLPKSRRRAEQASMRRQPNGVMKSQVIDELARDSHLVIATMAIYVSGIADVLFAAQKRNGEVNLPALSLVTRAVMEVAAVQRWLLTDEIDGIDRARRYLIWRFKDLDLQNRLITDSQGAEEFTERILAEAEAEVLELAVRFKWNARGRSVADGKKGPAVLLPEAPNNPGSVESMPSLTELVGAISDSYQAISMASHGSRFGVTLGSSGSDTATGPVSLGAVAGYGLPANVCLLEMCVAINQSVCLYAEWKGLERSGIATHLWTIARASRAGVDHTSE